MQQVLQSSSNNDNKGWTTLDLDALISGEDSGSHEWTVTKNRNSTAEQVAQAKQLQTFSLKKGEFSKKATSTPRYARARRMTITA